MLLFTIFLVVLLGSSEAFISVTPPFRLTVTKASTGSSLKASLADEPDVYRTTHRSGGWLPQDSRFVAQYVDRILSEAKEANYDWVPLVGDFYSMVKQDPVLFEISNSMFNESARHNTTTPVATRSITSFKQFITALNYIVLTVAPEYTLCENLDPFDPCGLIGFPINSLLDCPMGTYEGYAFFSNELVNRQLKKILDHWATTLLTQPASTYVLTQSDLTASPPYVAWLSDGARKELAFVANNAIAATIVSDDFFDIFEVPNKTDPPSFGFTSWDQFFTRVFYPHVRPVAEPSNPDLVVSACEAAPLQVVRNVQADSEFWLKGQNYSLSNMMGFHPLGKQFIGGIIYQAFLSALSYHRWNSPVEGTVVDTLIINGTYYLENLYQGFLNPDGPDDSAPNDSQPFLSAVATRAVIFIQAKGAVGLMCFIAIGMGEVGSCEITVNPGDYLYKGDPLGMFHFGGSTHCLCFRPGVGLEFIDYINENASLAAGNIAVKSPIARAYID